MFTEKSLIIGVDVHQRRNVTYVMAGNGQPVTKPRRFANNASGTDSLAHQLADLAEQGEFESIHLAAEATNNFWLPFFHHLDTAEALAAWPLVLYPFNPRHG